MPRKQKPKKTRYNGIWKLEDGRCLLKLKVTANGKSLWREKTLISGLTLREARLELELFRSSLLQEIQSGGPINPGQVRSVTDYAVLWLKVKAKDLGPATADRYVRDLDLHILPFFGQKRIRHIVRQDLSGWVAWAETRFIGETKEVYSWETVEGWWRLVRQLFQDAAVDLCLRSDPTYRVKGPKRRSGKKREQRTLSRDQLAQFLEVVKRLRPNRYAEVLALACTGMRPGELYALKPEHIRRNGNQGGQIDLVDSSWRGHLKEGTKTTDGRVVYAPPELLKSFDLHRRWMISSKHSGLQSGLLFPSNTGTVRSSGSLQKALNAACAEADIDIHVTPQVLRRTFDTLMVEAGVDRVVLWSMIGHSDERQTRRYAGVNIEAKREAVERVIPLKREGR